LSDEGKSEGKAIGHWFDPWERRANFIASLVVIGTAVVGILAWWWSDTYELTGVQGELSLGEYQTLAVVRRHGDAGSEPVTDMICRWRYQPSLPGLTSGNHCSVKITNDASFFAANAAQDIRLTTTVELWRQNSGGSSALATLSATTTLRYAALPKIDMPADTVLVGQSMRVGVSFPSEGQPTKFDCRWTPADRFTDANACTTDYNPDPAIQADTSTKLEVDVRGPDRTSLGTATREITVVVPPVHFMLFCHRRYGQSCSALGQRRVLARGDAARCPFVGIPAQRCRRSIPRPVYLRRAVATHGSAWEF
jgi:hypothetical protein